MKKIILFFSLILIGLTSKAQSGISCDSAKSFVSETETDSQTLQKLWYKFTAVTTAPTFTLTNSSLSAERVLKINMYAGSCPSGLSLIGSDTTSSLTDSVLSIAASGLTKGNIYYLEFIKANGTSRITYTNHFAESPLSGCDPSSTPCEVINDESFEANTSNPTLLNQLFLANCWENAELVGETDYFTAGGAPAVSVPNNSYGIQTAHTGNAYAGFFGYEDAVPGIGVNQHSYVRQQLTSSLILGKQYIVSYYVSLSETSSYATNDLGIWLTNATGAGLGYNDIGNMIDASPQIVHPSYVVNKTGWTKISGTYTATGMEAYIIMGNYGNSFLNLGTPPPPTGVKRAYYYIDDVSIFPKDSVITTVSDADSTICRGDTVLIHSTLFSGSETTWYWTTNIVDSSLIGHQNDSIIKEFPKDTTIYYIDITSAAGCHYFDTIKINVVPLPAMPKIQGDSFACVTGTPLPFTIANYDTTNTYSVSIHPVGLGGTASTINSTGHFTVTWNDHQGDTILVTVRNANGCDSVGKFIVRPCCISGDTTFINDSATVMLAHYGSTLSGVIAGKSFSINGIFTVDTNMSWDGDTVKLGQNAVIRILSPHTLVITQGSQLSACGDMWNQIFVPNGATLKVNKTAIIEDAKAAVYSYNGGKYVLDGAILNRNLKDVILTPFTGTHPGTIKATKFVCQPILGAIATLNPPYTGYRTQVGVEITGVKNVTIGTALTSTDQNLFKNMNVGISSVKSTLIVIGNVFNNISAGVAPNAGIAAIKAVGQVFTFPGYTARALTVGDGTAIHSNTINNCVNGIVTDLNMNVRINLNIIKNTFRNAIYIRNSKVVNTVLITKNTITNFSIGIFCEQNNYCTTNITLDTLRSPVPVPITGAPLAIAITDVNSANALYTVYDNYIEKVAVGINAKSVNNLSVNFNRINIKPVTGFFVSGLGVYLSNNMFASITSNATICNPASTNTAITGIFVQDSPHTLLNCNEIGDFGASIHFDGPANTFGTVFNNLMKNATDGFWLSNGVALGDQGGPAPTGIASDNKWQGTISSKTFISGTTVVTIGNLSRIFYRNTGAYVPTTNTAIFPGIAMIPQAILATNFPGICSVPAPPGSGHKAMIQVAKDSIYTLHEQKWLSKNAVYRELKADSTLIAGDTALSNFETTMDLQNTGKLFSSLELAATYDSSNYVTAQSILSSLSATDSIENYLKTVTTILLDQQSSGTDFDSTQLSTLRTIAGLCPYYQGTGVYLARALVFPYDAPGTEYQNICETDDARMMISNDAPVPAVIGDTKFLLFPNPNTGSMTLNYEINETDNAELFIYDITGRQINNYKLPANKNSILIKEDELNNGIYLYKIINNEKTVKTGRLVIIK